MFSNLQDPEMMRVVGLLSCSDIEVDGTNFAPPRTDGVCFASQLTHEFV